MYSNLTVVSATAISSSLRYPSGWSRLVLKFPANSSSNPHRHSLRSATTLSIV